MKVKTAIEVLRHEGIRRQEILGKRVGELVKADQATWGDRGRREHCTDETKKAMGKLRRLINAIRSLREFTGEI
jgi:hypothetical protein